MPKLFVSPTQLICNAIAFFILGIVIGSMIDESNYLIISTALTAAIAWALYSATLAPRLDLRPMTRVVMLLVGIMSFR